MRVDAGDAGVKPMGAPDTVPFTEFDYALQTAEAEAFVDYINGLGLTDFDGNPLTLEGVREGSYYDAVLQNISDALNAFVENTEFPLTVTVGRGANATEVTYNDLEDFFKQKYGDDTSAWLANDGGTYKVTDLAGFINGTSLVRNKKVPGFDTMNGDAENDAFGEDREFFVHYSDAVGQILKDNYEEFSKLDGFNQEEVDKYIEDTVGTGAEPSNDDAIDYQTNLMNATEILLGNNGLQKVNPAQYFRTRNGTADEHTSFTIAYNLCLAANMAGADANYSLVWDMGHGSNEGTTTGTFIDWVKEIAPAAVITGITLDPAEATIVTSHKDQNDSTLQIKAEITPAAAADQELVWTSSDETIATVDQTGKVTALRYGKVTITAEAKADRSIKGTAAINTIYYDVTGSADKSAEDYIYWYAPVYWAALVAALFRLR